MIAVSDVDLDVSVFDYVRIDNAERFSYASRSLSEGEDQNNISSLPTKTMSLPSRSLHGLWDMYVDSLSTPHRILA